MTKKDYYSIGKKLQDEIKTFSELQIIAESKKDKISAEYFKGRLNSIDHVIKSILIPAFREDNPKFSETRFIDYVYQLPPLNPQ
jgi:hypothetical protein